jgi:hypothetical protein
VSGRLEEEDYQQLQNTYPKVLKFDPFPQYIELIYKLAKIQFSKIIVVVLCQELMRFSVSSQKSVNPNNDFYGYNTAIIHKNISPQ